jgi:hypothetical protein
VKVDFVIDALSLLAAGALPSELTIWIGVWMRKYFIVPERDTGIPRYRDRDIGGIPTISSSVVNLTNMNNT